MQEDDFIESTGSRSSAKQRRDMVVAQIQKLIGQLGLDLGDRLPGERQLGVRFGVSRGTIREAIQFLATMGFLEVRHGGGSFLRAMPDQIGRLRAGWHQWVMRHRGRILETLEVRIGGEAFAAELAARRAGPDDLNQLMRALQSMKAVCVAPDPTAFVQCDLAFHDALLRSAGNETLRELLGALGEELIPERAAIAVLKGRLPRSYAQHLAIYEAVASGDGSRAAKAMREHLESVKQDILSSILNEGGASQPRTAMSTSDEMTKSGAARKIKPVAE